jgi:hypothetical protein
LMVDDDFLVLVNAWWEPLAFTLPETRPDAVWRLTIDTYDPGSAPGAANRGAGDSITVGPRSVAVLGSPRPSLPANGHHAFVRENQNPYPERTVAASHRTTVR